MKFMLIGWPTSFDIAYSNCFQSDRAAVGGYSIDNAQIAVCRQNKAGKSIVHLDHVESDCKSSSRVKPAYHHDVLVVIPRNNVCGVKTYLALFRCSNN